MVQEKSNRRRMGVVLSGLFILTLIMGAGPGLYLINPDPGNPQAVTSLWHVPVVYLWVVFWFLGQAAVVITAYVKLWDDGGKL